MLQEHDERWGLPAVPGLLEGLGKGGEHFCILAGTVEHIGSRVGPGEASIWQTQIRTVSAGPPLALSNPCILHAAPHA